MIPYSKIIANCQKNGTPEPEFQEYSGGFAVIFRFKEPMGGMRKKISSKQPVLNERQEKILQILSGEKTLRVNEIFDQLDDIASLRTVKADLSLLKKAGIVEQIGNGKLSLWKLKL